MIALSADPAVETRFEREGLLLCEMLRSSRLVLLYGEAGCGKTWLLRHSVLPALQHNAAAVAASECAVYFDAWDEAPLDTLNAQIRRTLQPAATTHGAARSLGAAPWVERLSVWTRESGHTLLVILDHFERFLTAPTDEGQEQFAREWTAAVAQPDLRVHFMVALRADAEPEMMARFQHRIPTLGDNRLVLPPLQRRRALDEPAAPTTREIRLPPAAGADEESPLDVGPLVDAGDDPIAVHGEQRLASEIDVAAIGTEPEKDALDESVLQEFADHPRQVQPLRRHRRSHYARNLVLFGVGAVLVAAVGWSLRDSTQVPAAVPAPAAPASAAPAPAVAAPAAPPLVVTAPAAPPLVVTAPARVNTTIDGSVRQESRDIAREIGFVLTTADRAARPRTIGVGLASPVPALSADGTADLAIVRADVLDALRSGAGADDALRLLLPLQIDPFYFVVRGDDSSAYVHQIARRRINFGAGGTDAAVGAMHLYRQLFDVWGMPEHASFLPDAAALDALLRDRAVDVVILAGQPGLSALIARKLRTAGDAFKLLALDPNHRVSRSALRSYLSIEIPPVRNAAWLDHAIPGLGVMSFLVARGVRDETAGQIVRQLCEQLPRLHQIGHPYGRDVALAPIRPVGWRYASSAERELRACAARRSPSAEKLDARATPASTLSRLDPHQGKAP